MSVISAQDAFQKLLTPEQLTCIDVRSENEFQDGHFHGVVNIPILNNEHRHQVGLTYKTDGQETAIKLGHELVDPLRPQLLEKWQKVSGNKETLVYCWRGGLRSKISCEWMREKHLSPLRVEGGYKAIRQIVLPHFSKSWPLIVITGMTGSQKTEVLNGAPNPIDLEGLANHRGSAFGQLINTEQPKQATFENNLSVALANSDSAQKLVFEDESRLVGQCIIPSPLYAQLTVAPLVRIEASVQSRAEYIFKSYVQLSLERAERGQVREHFQQSLLKISKKLGGALTDKLLKQMNEAFFHQDADLHQQWIESLLVNYYDKLYQHALNKKGREIVFSGSKEDVQDYLKSLKGL